MVRARARRVNVANRHALRVRSQDNAGSRPQPTNGSAARSSWSLASRGRTRSRRLHAARTLRRRRMRRHRRQQARWLPPSPACGRASLAA
eukprot:3849269-Pleurochrysis_carterae.AAC.6